MRTKTFVKSLLAGRNSSIRNSSLPYRNLVHSFTQDSHRLQNDKLLVKSQYMHLSLFKENDPIEQLAKKWSLEISEIFNAREQARLKREEFKQICEKEKFLTQDTSIVVFGSLARDEYTSGSDADWTLLIDGGANSDHFTSGPENRLFN